MVKKKLKFYKFKANKVVKYLQLQQNFLQYNLTIYLSENSLEKLR